MTFSNHWLSLMTISNHTKLFHLLHYFTLDLFVCPIIKLIGSLGLIIYI